MDFKIGPRVKTEFVDTNKKSKTPKFNGNKGALGDFPTDRADGVDFNNGFRPTVIIGTDTRTAVQNTKLYPYRVICALFLQFKKNGHVYRGTGTLIGPQHILTCAHNCYYNGNRVIGMDVVPGHTPSGNHNMGDTHATHVYFPDDYAKTQDGTLDYAIIKLADPIGKRLGYMGYREAKLAELRDLPVYVTGYPRFTTTSTAEQMYEGAGKVLKPQAQSIFHDVDTQGGQSGSAIYSFNDGDNNDEPTIFGIHTGGDTSPQPDWNIGVRLNEAVLTDIEKWIAK